MERRSARRFHHADEHGILFARVRPGLDAWVVNVSAGGALVETRHRLLPGSSIELAVQTVGGRASTRGMVVRCWVTRVQAGAIWYRGAVDFETQFSWLTRERMTGAVDRKDIENGSEYRFVAKSEPREQRLPARAGGLRNV